MSLIRVVGDAVPRVYPPPPVSRIACKHAGAAHVLCTKAAQDPDCKELIGQNLDNKGLTGFAVGARSTASALTMMA
jgi:hypothetical protein